MSKAGTWSTSTPPRRRGLHLLRLGREYVTDAEFRHIFELSCEKGFRAIIDLDFAAAANDKKEIATATRIGVFSSHRFIARGALEGMHRHDAFPLAAGTHHTRGALSTRFTMDSTCVGVTCRISTTHSVRY